MSVFTRFKDIISSNINSMLDMQQEADDQALVLEAANLFLNQDFYDHAAK